MAGDVDLGRQHESFTERQIKIVDVLVDAFSELMDADPEAFRQKFRKIAAGPFAFYRGSACLFYADMELICEWHVPPPLVHSLPIGQALPHAIDW